MISRLNRSRRLQTSKWINFRVNIQSSDIKVNVFQFPDDPDLRAKWIRMIPRKDYSVTKNTVVCQKLFAAEFIVKVDFVTWPDGSVIRDPRKRISCDLCRGELACDKALHFRPEFS
jgi:SET domain-containing protein